MLFQHGIITVDRNEANQYGCFFVFHCTHTLGLRFLERSTAHRKEVFDKFAEAAELCAAAADPQQLWFLGPKKQG